MVINIPKWRNTLLRAFNHWNEDRAPSLAAALAFFAVLSLSPLLVLAVVVAGRFLGEEHIRNKVLAEVTHDMGKGTADFLESVIKTAAQPQASAVATILSICVAIFGASNLFTQLADSVNFIWRARPTRTGFMGFLMTQLTSLVLVFGFLLLFASWVGLDAWLGWAASHTPGVPGWNLLSLAVSVVFLTGVFGVSYRALPRDCVEWSDVWFGATIAAVGFTALKAMLSLYFAYSGVQNAYGSAGALVVILLWIFYSAQIYFFGIEVVYAYAHKYGSQKDRKDGTEPIKRAKVRERKAYVS